MYDTRQSLPPEVRRLVLQELEPSRRKSIVSVNRLIERVRNEHRGALSDDELANFITKAALERDLLPVRNRYRAGAG